MREVRDFGKVADFLLPQSFKLHTAILFISILMIPGFLASLEPIDVQSYDMESPELVANQVVNEDFEAAEKTHGFAVSVRDSEAILTSDLAPHYTYDTQRDRGQNRHYKFTLYFQLRKAYGYRINRYRVHRPNVSP